MKLRMTVLLLGLLGIAPAWAQVDAGLGPWQLGMSREQVTALVAQGPYADGEGGALVTDKGTVGGRKATTSLVFGDAGLKTIDALVYDGKDWQEAAQAALAVYRHFAKDFGGASVKEVSDKVADIKEMETIVSRTIGTAEELNKQQVQRGRTVLVKYDMVPLNQPAGSRLQCQWTYVGTTGVYQVHVYLEKADAPSRDAEENVEIVRPEPA